MAQHAFVPFVRFHPVLCVTCLVRIDVWVLKERIRLLDKPRNEASNGPLSAAEKRGG